MPVPHSKPGAGASPRFVFLYALAYTALWLALLPPIIVTLALKAEQLAPQHGAQSVSWVLSIGALFAMVSNPFFGALSDRSTSRFGRRRPWLIGGSLSGIAALLIVAAAPTLDMLVIGWCLAQLAFNAALTAMIAVLPDQVPVEQRGTVAGILGVCMPIGMIGGTYLVQAFSSDLWLAIVAPGVIGASGVLLFALTLEDAPAPPRADDRGTGLLRRYLVKPGLHADFAWAWISRVFLVIGTATFQTYQPFFLMDRLQVEIGALPALIFLSTLVQSALAVLSSMVSGRWSDRISRRKVFVFCGLAIYGCALLCIATADSHAMFLLAVAATGIGQGMYVGVDLALFADILPHPQRDAARDLGLVNITNTLPQILSPALSPLILAASGGSYFVLFVATACVCLAGSLTILPVKRVR